MSALPAPPSPRLRVVPAGGAGSLEQAQAPVVRSPQGREASRRGHLRLVTGDFAPSCDWAPSASSGCADGRVPVAVRFPGGRRHASRSQRLTDLAEMAPSHPAVRAAQRRQRSCGVASRQAPTRGVRTAVPTRRGERTVSAARVQGPQGSRPCASGARPLPAPIRRSLQFAAMAVSVALMVGIGIVASAFTSDPVDTTTTTVGAGQSLWDVAQATGTEDVPETAAVIVDLNDLETSTIHPGQILVVPAY